MQASCKTPTRHFQNTVDCTPGILPGSNAGSRRYNLRKHGSAQSVAPPAAVLWQDRGRRRGCRWRVGDRCRPARRASTTGRLSRACGRAAARIRAQQHVPPCSNFNAWERGVAGRLAGRPIVCWRAWPSAALTAGSSARRSWRDPPGASRLCGRACRLSCCYAAGIQWLCRCARSMPRRAEPAGRRCGSMAWRAPRRVPHAHGSPDVSLCSSLGGVGRRSHVHGKAAPAHERQRLRRRQE